MNTLYINKPGFKSKFNMNLLTPFIKSNLNILSFILFLFLIFFILDLIPL